MPKILDYPRDSLIRSLELAAAVDALGGSCAVEMCAEHMHRKSGSGSFTALTSAANKYGLVETSQSRISTTDIYKTYKHAYSESERISILRDIILRIPVFEQLISRFMGQQVPKILERLLIREFGIREGDASRVQSYFLDAITEAKMLDSGNKITLEQPKTESSSTEVAVVQNHLRDSTEKNSSVFKEDGFKVVITGPDLRTEISVKDPEDIVLIEAMLRKIKRSISHEQGQS